MEMKNSKVEKKIAKYQTEYSFDLTELMIPGSRFDSDEETSHLRWSIAVSSVVGFGLVYFNPKIGIGPRQIDELVNDRL